MKTIAFDLEIANEFPDEGEPDHSKLGISCAATLTSDGTDMRFHSPAQHRGEMYGERMTPNGCQGLLDHLMVATGGGYNLVCWNGNFDLRVLAYEVGTESGYKICQSLAREMYDPMFQFYVDNGFPVGLEAVAKAMLGRTKTEGLHGDAAPILWKESKEKQEKVLRYCAGDVALTLALFEEIERKAEIQWITRAEKKRFSVIGQVQTVGECMTLLVVGTPWWPNNPFSREQFVGWLEE